MFELIGRIAIVLAHHGDTLEAHNASLKSHTSSLKDALQCFLVIRDHLALMNRRLDALEGRNQ